MEGGGAAAKAKAVLGPKITVEPIDFLRILAQLQKPVVIVNNPGSIGLSKTWQYMTSYKGFLFHTVSKRQLELGDCEIYETKKMA